MLVFASGTVSLRGCPRKFVFRLGEKKSLGCMQLLPFRMLKQNTRSAINRLCSKLSSLSFEEREALGVAQVAATWDSFREVALDAFQCDDLGDV